MAEIQAGELIEKISGCRQDPVAIVFNETLAEAVKMRFLQQ